MSEANCGGAAALSCDDARAVPTGGDDALAVPAGAADTNADAPPDAGAAAQENAPPDPDQDIIAFLRWQAAENARLGQQLAELTGKRVDQSPGETASAPALDNDPVTEQAIWQNWQDSAAEAKAIWPDFDAACAHLAESRDRQLQVMSLLQPALGAVSGRNQRINAELRDIIVAARQNGGNAAAIIYQLARSHGFTASEHATAEEADALLQRQAHNRSASRTIAGSNGAAAADPLSAEAIAHMPAAEFEHWISDPANERRLDRLMGG